MKIFIQPVSPSKAVEYGDTDRPRNQTKPNHMVGNGFDDILQKAIGDLKEVNDNMPIKE